MTRRDILLKYTVFTVVKQLDSRMKDLWEGCDGEVNVLTEEDSLTPPLPSLTRHGHFFIFVVPHCLEETIEQIRISAPTLEIGKLIDIFEIVSDGLT